MIVRDRPTGWQVFFVLRGSVVVRVLPQILGVMAVGLAAAFIQRRFPMEALELSPAPFTIVGLLLSIFLGFRNTTSYERFWEGRKLWAELSAANRALARQVLSLITPYAGGDQGEASELRRRMLYRSIALAHALRDLLRDEDSASSFALLSPYDRSAVSSQPNRPEALLRLIATDLSLAIQRKWIGEPLARGIDETLSRIGVVLAGSERLHTTPIPLSYTLLLHRTAYLYCYLLPFGIADAVGYATPFVVGLVAYAFFGLNSLSHEVEDPFGRSVNDLPLDALCRLIEIDLRAALGETDLPEPLQPTDFVLS